MTESVSANEQFAALDLGSNSFHLIVAQQQGDHLQVIDKIKDMVRLASGFTQDNQISEEAKQRALECLERFGQRLRTLPSANVRVVGTNTLRKARKKRSFVLAAEEALGFEIELISGREEARLIYLGAARALEDNHDQRLVVDIGGGSTELILGHNREPKILNSLYVGCVELTERCFPKGELKSAYFKEAIEFARQEFEHLEQAYKQFGWDTVIGTSGTIHAIREVLQTLDQETEITLEGLKALQKHFLEFTNTDQLNLPNISKERAASLPGGLSVLIAIYKTFEIQKMRVADGALREGLLYELVGRGSEEDIRESSVNKLIERYKLDHAHAGRIKETALYFLAQVAKSWELKLPEDNQLLSWSSHVHELGMSISHNQYHKHGEYLIKHMDLSGFSQEQQTRLAFLVRVHRRKFPDQLGELLPDDEVERLTRLAVLLRLSVLLHRNRNVKPLPHIEIIAKNQKLTICFPDSWLQDHPLGLRDLELETKWLKPSGIELILKDIQ